jgi:hypothetical protein
VLRLDEFTLWVYRLAPMVFRVEIKGFAATTTSRSAATEAAGGRSG